MLSQGIMLSSHFGYAISFKQSNVPLFSLDTTDY